MKRANIIKTQSTNTCFMCHPFARVIVPSFRLCSISSAANNFLHIFGGFSKAEQIALKTALVSSWPLNVELLITTDGNRLEPYLAQYSTSLSMKSFLVDLSVHFDLSGVEKLSWTHSLVLSKSSPTSLCPYLEQSSLIPSSHSS